MKETILIIDDEQELLENCVRILEHAGFKCVSSSDPLAALELFHRHKPDLILTDLKMPAKDGLEILREVRALDSAIPIILFTAFATWETAVTAIKDGASDYLAKPISKDQLLVIVEKSLREKRLREENTKLKQELGLSFGFDKLIGASPQIKKVLEIVKKIAPTEANVLVEGESGTGKELIARAVHRNSRRGQAGGRFVPVDCASLPEHLLEAELFGHEKGAFTDAQFARPGLFEFADGGTIFLDEIGEMSLPLQAKLLRVLQEKQFRRLGSNRLITVDFRLVSATNRNLKKEIEAHRFREDLYYRLNVIAIGIPPLRDRDGDIELLANYFLREFSNKNNLRIRGISPFVIKILKGVLWPGNVRELENVMEHSVSLASSDIIQVGDLPEYLRAAPSEDSLKNLSSLPEGSFKESKSKALKSFYDSYFQGLLAKHGGNISQAAEEAKIDRKTIHRLLSRYSIQHGKLGTAPYLPNK